MDPIKCRSWADIKTPREKTSHIPRPTSPSFTSAPAMSSKVTLEENHHRFRWKRGRGICCSIQVMLRISSIQSIPGVLLGWECSIPSTCIKFGKHIMNHIFHKATWYYMKTLSYININTPALVRCQYLHPQTVKSSFPAWPKPFEMRAWGGVPKRTIGWI